jgi:nitroimidazol reductase NimA-like FMN-containing flavoprotein (pyridoxamine 5'-phosphate oxidase superfamily)
MRLLQTEADLSYEALDREECLVLLRWEPLVRLAVAAPGCSPIVVPINFVLDGETVVFRSDPGEKLTRLADQPVSLQADRFDWYRRIGWSVLVQGTAREIDPAEVDGLDLHAWAPGAKDHFVRVIPDSITGRRLVLERPETDQRGYR